MSACRHCSRPGPSACGDCLDLIADIEATDRAMPGPTFITFARPAFDEWGSEARGAA